MTLCTPEPAMASAPETTPAAEQKPSATTSEIPSFGWSGYAERINGRFAMVGFVAILLIEAISGTPFLQWAGLR